MSIKQDCSGKIEVETEENYFFKVAVNVKTLQIFAILHKHESEEELLARANRHKAEEIEKWENACKTDPTTKNVQYLDEARESEYVLMTYLEYHRAKLCGGWESISEQEYDKMLNILPPLDWENGGFFMSEFYVADISHFYQKWQGEYYRSFQPYSRPREEILNELQEKIAAGEIKSVTE